MSLQLDYPGESNDTHAGSAKPCAAKATAHANEVSSDAPSVLPEAPAARSNFARIALIYLIGLFIGGIYVGLIAPLRTVIQADMGVDSTVGIWMINIYTLFYASTIPVTGSLADRYGRKPLFLACVGLFVGGALLCGLSQQTQSFALLLIGRVIQAVGAGGIIPVATAEMGVSAPPDKRGMWLGLTAAVSGLANVIGAAVGSAVVAIVGVDHWQWAFYLVVPVGVLLIAGGAAWLPRKQAKPQGKLDAVGAVLFTTLVVLLLLCLKAVDFTDLASSVGAAAFLGCLAGALVVGVAFALVERHAENPTLHLEFFTNRKLLIILIVSFFVGCCVISMQLVPEFAEFALGAPLGSGGYYMAIIGVFAIAGPPTSGKLIDRFGAKPVLMGGLAVTAGAFVFLATFVAAFPSVPSILAGLALVGLGMGFAMGTPLNYLTLQNVEETRATSAVATATLLRQMGTTLSPAFLVSFTVATPGMDGYAHMLLAVAAFNAISIALMALYRETRASRE